jgi:geranylgeranyl pyrophosphate synthase
MAVPEKLMLRVNVLLEERGKEGLKRAQQEISRQKIAFAPLNEALSYFMEEIWFDYMHPGLMSLACEAVGGNPEETVDAGGAFALLAGGADAHDDIIDQSATKGSRLTVFGKFGKDITILTGDVLLFTGMNMLNEATKTFQEEKKKQILDSVRQAFLGISSAEAQETSFRGKEDLKLQEYFNMLKLKVSVASSTTKIGAILGNGSEKEIEVLSHFGETFGILNTVRDEFIDMFEVNELKNRAENEFLPLPILLTFQDPEKKRTILQLLKQPTTNEIIQKILDTTLDSNETRKFTLDMRELAEKELQQVLTLKSCQAELSLILQASLEDL